MIKTGDKVKVINNVYSLGFTNLKGKIGTVKTEFNKTSLLDFVGIVFDEFIDGHELTRHPEVFCSEGRGWYIAIYNLEKLEQLELF